MVLKNVVIPYISDSFVRHFRTDGHQIYSALLIFHVIFHFVYELVHQEEFKSTNHQVSLLSGSNR